MVPFELFGIYEKQIVYQEKLNGSEVFGKEDPQKFADSMLGMFVEGGEALHEDERWKVGIRNHKYDRDKKVEELADCFLFLLNALIFSEIGCNEFLRAVEKKQNINLERLKEKVGGI